MKCPSCRGLGSVAFQITADESDIDICLDCEGTGKVPELFLEDLIRAKNEEYMEVQINE